MLDRKRVFDDQFEAFSKVAGNKLVSLYDAKAQLTRWSPAAVKLFKFSGQYLYQGAYEWGELVHPDDREVYTTCMTKLAIGKLSHYDLFYRVRIADGRYAPFHTVGGTIHNEDGLPDFIGGIVESEGITDRICPLTGLGNKLAFDFNRKQSGAAERYITVVDFERINSEQGYNFGNAYLLKLVERPTELVGDDKCLYRLHGATFAILS